MMILGMIVGSILTGVGIVCGLGNCSSNNNNDDKTNAPGSVTINSTSSPILSPMNNGDSNPTTVTAPRPIGSAIPTLSPLTTIITTTPPSPTITMEEQVRIACQFLNVANLVQCQNTTSNQGFQVVGNTIPTEMGLLTQLTQLDLRQMNLAGRIPSTLGKLTQLVHLTLANNQLTGTIPTTLGSLTQLSRISFFLNQLSGTIPTTLSHLTQLNLFDFGNNQLNGTLPTSLGNLLQLQGFGLGNNPQLSGPIPTELVQLTNLSYFSMSGCQLNGTIPSMIGNLVNINELHLNFNQFTGSIPSTLGNLVDMTELYLDQNRLTGTIPGTMENLVRNIQTLSLYNNMNLFGVIPSPLCNTTAGITGQIIIDCENVKCSCCTSGNSASCPQL
jgi:Leucine-rich repeat (LRR) protein